jgi:hypothetical protein
MGVMSLIQQEDEDLFSTSTGDVVLRINYIKMVKANRLLLTNPSLAH